MLKRVDGSDPDNKLKIDDHDFEGSFDVKSSLETMYPEPTS
jgi:hypothetical protein